MRAWGTPALRSHRATPGEARCTSGWGGSSVHVGQNESEPHITRKWLNHQDSRTALPHLDHSLFTRGRYRDQSLANHAVRANAVVNNPRVRSTCRQPSGTAPCVIVRTPD